MKKLLFPTDFSDVSKNAFIYALKLADAIKAEIIILHVYEMDLPVFIDSSIFSQDIYQYQSLKGFENFKEEMNQFQNISKTHTLEHIPIHNVLSNGNLVDEIIKISEKENIDFIVMGTKGISNFSQIFLGNTTTRIMNESKITVLGIPEMCEYKKIDKILFTTKYKLKDIEALKKVQKLADVLQASIDCLNVKPPHEVNNDDSIVDFQNVFKNQNITFHSILSNDVEGVILEFIEQNNINMIAIPIKHKSFFEKLFLVSLSKKLAITIDIPFLSLQ